MVFCVRKWIYPGTLVDVRPAAGTGLPSANPYAVGVKVWYKWRAAGWAALQFRTLPSSLCTPPFTDNHSLCYNFLILALFYDFCESERRPVCTDLP